MKEGKISKNLTRILSSVILFPLFAVLLVFANNVVMDVFLGIISVLCLYEYYRCFTETKKANASEYVGYVVAILIMLFFINGHITGYSFEMTPELIGLLLPISLLVLICELILSKGKKNIIDIAVTMLGIIYIPYMIMYLSMIRQFVDIGQPIGNILIWYVFISAWGSDIFAYFVGRRWGKHHFTKVSPNKTIEGCIGGICGALVISIIYTIAIRKFLPIIPDLVDLNVLKMAIITIVLSFIGQIGDLAASSIKRYCGIKDFGDIIPGHGGMLDRIDSVIFILPFAYILLALFVI